MIAFSSCHVETRCKTRVWIPWTLVLVDNRMGEHMLEEKFLYLSYN